MKKSSILLVLILLFFTSCKMDRIECNEPYMRFETGCCLDENENKICDSDEVKQDVGKKEEIIEEQPTPIIVEENPLPTTVDKEIKPEPAFTLELIPVKDHIRILDQAIFIMKIDNLKRPMETYTIEITDQNWYLKSSPYMVPIRAAVGSLSSNKIRLILQPNKKYITEKGNYTIDLIVNSEKNPATEMIQARIHVI